MELNPKHPVTKSMHDQWHKIVALLMSRFKTDHEVFSMQDIEQSICQGNMNIVVQELSNGLHIRIVDDVTAKQLAKEHIG